ncbi:purine-binding chemotaxis protein CheW [Gluconobacter cerinus]|uniref:Chemotaxis protein CheW n=1 Tax=Gluconobacter cerinus TaxID=38307 RepID=A0AAV5NDA3_9PROT|nr:chemotaxis protein CheW [Gluconobacter cerinus]MBS1031317.1 purine-binding chemotaxis protein CheW [Gluconobacter cerinus]GBR05047.1 chemotaxis protein CheW [Gluconobacter cerinus NRIC 0229]GLQ62271.1 chemotaxis protein CheW [Gluconobacter cerinus]
MSKSLVFLSNNQEYSIDISYVKEIRNWIKSTIIPNSPEFVEGIINIRGSVIPLINFGKKINSCNENILKKAIIILEGDNKIISFSVDDVLEILSYHKEDLRRINFNENCSILEGIISFDERTIFKINESFFIKECIND